MGLFGGGWYFVAVCRNNRQGVFGGIVDGSVILSPVGLIVEKEWRRTLTVRKQVVLEEFVVMPNFLHEILVLNGDRKKTSQRDVSTKKG